MIIGVGVDVVDVARFARSLERMPRLRDKLFTPPERELSTESLAVRFAAKEAVAKALRTPGNLRWHDVTVHRSAGGPPVLEVSGTVAARAAELGVDAWHLSLSHDGGIATAFVVAEGRAAHERAAPRDGTTTHDRATAHDRTARIVS